jgi:PAT family beta-lactamase induction signal transducer AmpG
MAIGTSMTGFALAHGGMSLASLLAASAVAAPLSLIAMLRERPGERLMPWTDGYASARAVELHAGAWIPILTGVFRATARLHTLLFSAGTLLCGATLGIFYAVAPLMGTRIVGWTDSQISSLTGTGSLAGAFVTVAAIGWITDRAGARRTAIGIASVGVALALTMLAIQASWAFPALFTAFVILFLAQNTAGSTANCAVMMRLCDPKVGATQFGLFMAIGNFGISIGGALVGTLDALGGLQALIAAMAVAHVGAMLLFLLARVGR